MNIGYKTTASIDAGIVTLENGRQIDLTQALVALNNAFVETGTQEYASAADLISGVIGIVQTPHGDLIDIEPQEPSESQLDQP